MWDCDVSIYAYISSCMTAVSTSPTHGYSGLLWRTRIYNVKRFWDSILLSTDKQRKSDVVMMANVEDIFFVPSIDRFSIWFAEALWFRNVTPTSYALVKERKWTVSFISVAGPNVHPIALLIISKPCFDVAEKGQGRYQHWVYSNQIASYIPGVRGLVIA